MSKKLGETVSNKNQFLYNYKEQTNLFHIQHIKKNSVRNNNLF